MPFLSASKVHDLTLKDRFWTCEKCDSYHDRDVNASKNILDFGLHRNNLVGAGRPDVKPLENISLESSAKEETTTSSVSW